MYITLYIPTWMCLSYQLNRNTFQTSTSSNTEKQPGNYPLEITDKEIQYILNRYGMM